MIHSIRIVDYRVKRSKFHLFKRFATSSLFACGFFAPGLLADSAAMQWAGFALLIFCMFLALLAYNYQTLTISEAREYLDKLENSHDQ